MYPNSQQYQPYMQPRGDAFLAFTPDIDNASKQLAKEEQDRQATAQAQSDALDKQMSTDVGKMRGVDVPDYINKYNNYRDLQTRVYTDKGLQKDPVALAKVRTQAAVALGDLNNYVDESMHHKQTAQDLNSVYGQNPEKMQDNFVQLHQAYQNTPLNKLNNVNVGGKSYDMTNASPFFDTTPQMDFNSMHVKAMGKATNENDFSDVPNPSDPLTTIRTPKMFGADPNTYTQSLIGQLASKKAGKYAAHAWSLIPPDTIQKIQNQYDNLTPERKKQIGMQDGQPALNLDNAQSDAEKFAILKGMDYAVNSPVLNGKITNLPNAQKKADLTQSNKVANMQTQFNYAESKMKLASNLGLNAKNAFDDLERNKNLLSKQQADESATAFYNGELQRAQVPDNKVKYQTTTGATVEGYKTPLLASAEKELYIGKGIHSLKPQEIIYNPDKNEFTGIIKHTGDDGTVKVETVTKPASVIQLHYRDALNKGRSDKEGGVIPSQPKDKKSRLDQYRQLY